jgi:striatin 1/3/4
MLYGRRGGLDVFATRGHPLKGVRTKTVTTVSKPPGIAPARLAALQDEDRASNRDEKEGSGSEGSEDGGMLRP